MRRTGQPTALVMRLDVMHHDPWIAELGSPQDGLQPGEECTVTSPVDAQGLLLAGGLSGLQVGDDVTAAECVDRLLRVTDQNQRRGAVECLVDHLPLHRVGVLELIDHDDGPAPAHPHPRR